MFEMFEKSAAGVPDELGQLRSGPVAAPRQGICRESIALWWDSTGRLGELRAGTFLDLPRCFFSTPSPEE
jgi:hypothetical protein